MKDEKLKKAKYSFSNLTPMCYIIMIIGTIIIATAIGSFTPFEGGNVTYKKIKLSIDVVAPMLTILLFFRTIQTQQEATEVSRKADINQNFYKLLDVFLINRRELTSNTPQTVFREFAEWNQEGNLSNLFFLEKALKENEDKFLYTDLKYDTGLENEEQQAELSCCLRKMQTQYDENENQVSSYLKSLLRMMRLLNKAIENRIIDNETYFMYINIITSQLTEDEFITILYNCLFVEKCCNLAIEMLNTSFFGDREELENNQNFKLMNPLSPIVFKYFVSTKENYSNRIFIREKFNDNKGIIFMELIREDVAN